MLPKNNQQNTTPRATWALSSPGSKVQENPWILTLDDCLHFHETKKTSTKQKGVFYWIRCFVMALLFLKWLFFKEKCDSIASGLRMSSFLWPNNCSMPEATSNSPMHGDAQQQPMAFKEFDDRSKIELCFEQKLSAMKGSIVWSCVRMWLPFSAMNTPCCHQGKTLQIKATKALPSNIAS